ncbi:MAG TPA: aminotransferase class I/II-fold pyridoxal phosphate-dependent enzyme [Burkholderiaceae bacterium]
MFVSRRLSSTRPLATTHMHGRVEALRAAGVPVIDFSIALSHFPAPQAVRDAVADGLRQHALPYTSVAGAAGLRDALARKAQDDNGIDADSAEIIVTNGAKQALYQSLYAMTDPGDSVIVFRPYWPAYLATAQLLDLNVQLVDLPDAFTPDTLAALPPAKVLVLNNPHNPTGKVHTKAELDLLAGWLAAQGARAIVDESYEKLAFEGLHYSLASRCDWRALGVVTIFSASQSYAMMGWRTGFAVAPRALVTAMETLQGPITAAPAALTQLACGAAFASGETDTMMADYRIRRDLVLDMVKDVPWLRMACPAAGPYLWGDVSALTGDTVTLAEQLLEHCKVAVMPGEALGVPGFIRIGFIADDHATLREGVARILAFGNRLAAGEMI